MPATLLGSSVLLFEEKAMLTSGLGQELERRGASVLHVCSSGEALDLLSDRNIDFAVLEATTGAPASARTHPTLGMVVDACRHNGVPFALSSGLLAPANLADLSVFLRLAQSLKMFVLITMISSRIAGSVGKHRPENVTV